MHNEFAISGTSTRVRASSVKRLPFQPAGELLELRGALRRALSALVTTGMLHAEYCSPFTDPCDVENVLLYNVGMSWIRALAVNGLIFERGFAVEPNVEGHQHSYRYDTECSEGFRLWEAAAEHASWSTTLPLRGRGRPAEWFRQIRSAVRFDSGHVPPDAPFGVAIRVGSSSPALSTIVKPALDGAIAAMHCDGAPDRLALERLAQELDLDPAAVRELLEDPRSPLGDRRLVRVFRSRIQWNPADDRCVAAALLVDGRLAPEDMCGSLFRVVRL